MDLGDRVDFFESYAFLILVEHFSALISPFHDFAEQWMDGGVGEFARKNSVLPRRFPAADEEER